MATTGTTIQGAARLRGRAHNPDILLRSIMDAAADPHDRDVIIREFNAAVFPQGLRDLMEPEAQDLLLNVCLAWASNAYIAAIRRYPRPGQNFIQRFAEKQRQQHARQAAKLAAIREAAAKVEKVVVKKAKALVLEMIAPNGKAIGDCTCGELVGFGSWFAALGAKGKPNQIVRKVITEAVAYRLAPKNLF